MNRPRTSAEPRRTSANRPRTIAEPRRNKVKRLREIAKPPREIVKPPREIVKPLREMAKRRREIIQPPHEINGFANARDAGKYPIANRGASREASRDEENRRRKKEIARAVSIPASHRYVIRNHIDMRV